MTTKFTSLDDINQYNNYNRLKRFLSFSYSHFFTASAPLPLQLKFEFAVILAQKNHSEWQDVPPQYIQFLWKNQTFQKITELAYIDLQTPSLPDVMAKAIAQGISVADVTYIYNLIAKPTLNQQQMAQNAIQVEKQIRIIKKSVSNNDQSFKKVKKIKTN